MLRNKHIPIYLLGLLAPMTSVIAMACGPGGPVGGTFSTLLAHIPDTPETRREVSINDFARLRELFDIPLPDAGADHDELIEYLNEHLGPVGAGVHLGLADSPWISGYTGNWEGEQYTLENLAFGIHNVDQSVLAGPPPGRLEIVEGLFDPEATERALENC